MQFVGQFFIQKILFLFDTKKLSGTFIKIFKFIQETAEVYNHRLHQECQATHYRKVKMLMADESKLF